jgi:hypothetical protein
MKLPMLYALLSLCLVGATAVAQTEPYPGACKADARKLCSAEVSSRDKDKIQACLVANAEKVSANCRENLKAAKAAKDAKDAKAVKDAAPAK